MGHELDLLDAYVTGAFDVGDAALDLRVGRHVLNWGESTFITNGINAFNRFDVSKLRLPGSELREALAPIPMVSLSVAPTYNLSVEGFYQLDWEETVIDPVGSYFSTTDYVGPGASEAVIADPVAADLLDPSGAMSIATLALTRSGRPSTLMSSQLHRGSSAVGAHLRSASARAGIRFRFHDCDARSGPQT